MRIVETKVYQFSELSDQAKDNVRSYYRRQRLDDRWWDSVLEDFASVAGHLGYEAKADRVFFSGFSSQVDGACFEGTFRSENVSLKALISYAPQDAELLRIGNALTSFVQDHPRWYATIKHHGRHTHEYETEFTCEELNVENEDATTAEHETEFTEISRDLMRWLYKQLHARYEYLQADDAIAEYIEAHAYEFTENGKHLEGQ